MLTTAQAASQVPAGLIGTTLAMYLAVYAVLIAAYVSVLFHLAGKGVTRPPAALAPASVRLAGAAT